MSHNKQTDKFDQLMELCEKQIGAILEDSEKAFGDLTTNALAQVREISRLRDGLASQGELNTELKKQFQGLDELSDQVIMRLQFLDEYAQRAGHVRTLIQILRQDKEIEGVMANIESLFATRAEHEVLASMFDVEESQAVQGSDIELF